MNYLTLKAYATNLVQCTARKIIFSFSKCSEKIIFPKKQKQKQKKSQWNIVFLVSSGKTIFLYPENMILFFRRKMKDDVSQKEYMEVWYVFQIFWKDGLSKNIALEYDLCYIIRKDGISFSRKNDIFFDGWTIKDDLSQKIYGNMLFSVCSVKIVFLFHTNMKLPFC